jgi:hypothetical protein
MMEKVTDVAADLVQAAEEEFSDEDYRRVVRKADFILLPLMWVSVSSISACW